MKKIFMFLVIVFCFNNVAISLEIKELFVGGTEQEFTELEARVRSINPEFIDAIQDYPIETKLDAYQNFITKDGNVSADDAIRVATANVDLRNFSKRVKDFVNAYPDESAEIVQRASNFSYKDTNSFILFYAVSNVFEQYKNEMIELFQSRGEQTGRDVKIDNNCKWADDYETCTTRIWLDKGIQGTSECKDDEEHPRQACFYPDGYEQWEMVVKHTSEPDCEECEFYSLGLIKEDSTKNTRNVIQIKYRGSSSSEQTDFGDNRYFNTFVMISGEEMRYNEWHQYRNDRVEDIKNGMLDEEWKEIPCAWKRDKKTQEWYQPIGCKSKKIDWTKPWKSRISPSAAVYSENIDSSYDYTESIN